MKTRRALVGFITTPFLALFAVAAHNCAVADANITKPLIPAFPSVAEVFKPGSAINLIGTATGAGFTGFTLEWARGLNPGGPWLTAGVSLSGGGVIPVVEALLGSWVPGTALESDYYTLRLTVSSGGSSEVIKTSVYLERDLFSNNWPKWLEQSPSGASPRVFHDSTSKAHFAIVNPVYLSTTFPSLLWIFDLNGSEVDTNVLYYGGSFEPAVGNLDSNPGEEVLATEGHLLRVTHPDGSYYSIVPTPDSNLQYASINLADLNGDFQQEILALGSDLRTSDGWLYAWTPSGQPFSTNFPVRIPDASFDLRTSLVNRLVQVDLDMDGLPELLVIGCESSTTFSLIVLRGDGKPGPWAPLTFTGTFRQLAVGDLDHDGSPEIVLAYTDDTGGWVQVLSADGIPRTGWPFRLGGGLPVHVVLGDLDRDGKPEIVVTEYSKLYVFRSDGSAYPGWPLQGGAFNVLGIPVIADVDGDGAAEIVISVSDLLYSGDFYNTLTLKAFKSDGRVARSWKLMGANGNQPAAGGTATIGDFDGDGQAELAINYQIVSGGGSSGHLHEGVLTVLTLGVPYRPHPADWPTAYHDSRNSSRGFTAGRLNLTRQFSNWMLSWPFQPETSSVMYSDSLEPGSWLGFHGFVGLNHGRYSQIINPTNNHRAFRLQYW